MNVAPGPGVAVRPTVESCLTFAAQVALPFPQLIPPPVTIPCPVTVTASATVALEPPENVAVTDLAAFMVREQVAVEPLHDPPQDVNVSPSSGVAVRVTFVPAFRVAEQLVPPAPQFRPPPVTVPSPTTETVNGKVDGVTPPPPPEKVAVTFRSADIVTVQTALLPLQAPPQPVNEPPDGGVAVRVTSVSAVSSAAQPEPLPDVHAIPPPVTVPVPLTVTVRRGLRKDALTEWSAFICTTQLLVVPEQSLPQPPKM
jgi:hypothetical protein